MLDRVNKLFKQLHILSAIILLFSSIYVSAQTVGSNIEINVKDANNASVTGAEIVLRNSKRALKEARSLMRREVMFSKILKT